MLEGGTGNASVYRSVACHFAYGLAKVQEYFNIGKYIAALYTYIHDRLGTVAIQMQFNEISLLFIFI